MNSSFLTPSFTKMLYGWSKWGGRFCGIAREFLEVWSCQICGEKQLFCLPQYFLPIDEDMREFIRICAGCFYDVKKAGVGNYNELLESLEDFKERRRSIVRDIIYYLQTSLKNKLK